MPERPQAASRTRRLGFLFPMIAWIIVATMSPEPPAEQRPSLSSGASASAVPAAPTSAEPSKRCAFCGEMLNT
jgi:hypothetical protein